jgi:hypothetical protein
MRAFGRYRSVEVYCKEASSAVKRVLLDMMAQWADPAVCASAVSALRYGVIPKPQTSWD